MWRDYCRCPASYNVRNLQGICLGISTSPTVRKIISLNASSVRNPLARFLTIWTMRLRPSAMALVSRVFTNARTPKKCWRSVLTNFRSGSRPLLSADVVQLLRKRSAAQGALYSQNVSNSSLSLQAL